MTDATDTIDGTKDKDTAAGTGIDAGATGTVIDLRPPEGDIRRNLLRLGLKADSYDTATDTYTYRNYDRGLAARFAKDGKVVELEDVTTGILRNAIAGELEKVSDIITWLDEPVTTPAA